MPKIVLFGQPSRAKRKANRPRLGWEDFLKVDLNEMGASWEGGSQEGGFEWIGGEACVAVLAIGNLVLQ